jgi:hypothetical protein
MLGGEINGSIKFSVELGISKIHQAKFGVGKEKMPGSTLNEPSIFYLLRT